MDPDIEKTTERIVSGRTTLGIEFGSTRIKAVLCDEDFTSIASGSFTWENKLVDGYWTYSDDDVWDGLASCFASLKEDVRTRYGVVLKTTGAIGISAMMHGYLAFDDEDDLLVPFRTWRNTTTTQAATELTQLFGFHIPERWSVAHLRQAMLNGEQHVGRIDFLTTLAGYVHWRLTGERVIGVGDASGMFPIDPATGTYDRRMLEKFDDLVEPRGYPWRLGELLPKVLPAGACAGNLTEQGARLLDREGDLAAGIPLCPPEGDAGTGMTATNSVSPRTGNVSAGTSVFAMVVLERALTKPYPQIDVVTTPMGHPVAMVHCNNCTSDLNAWVELFAQYNELMGVKVDRGTLYTKLFEVALTGDRDCGGIMSSCCVSGEPILGVTEGRPLFVRGENSNFTLANFMRMHLMSALGALKLGCDILTEEGVKVDRLMGHGGFFKTEGVGQSILAAAMNAPVTVLSTAGEGGAWGIALLAAYLVDHGEGEDLGSWLDSHVFSGMEGHTIEPTYPDVAGYESFMRLFLQTVEVEKAAVSTITEKR